MIRALRNLRRLARREDGTATIEFVILFPIFMILAVTGVEMGVLTLRQVMLERGVDITVRALRVGSMTDPTFESVRDAICANSLIIPDCAETLHLELTPISTDNFTVPETAVTCVDRTHEVEPIVNFTQGQRNAFMLLRACAVFDPMFPTYGLGPDLPTDASGGYRIIASTSFVNEP
ncbi:TadE/TadG family type IV pilus assembly protein [Frigidibacter sp. ROC022]|uniref:TadE/TadG family type IV pilus assembly protein n=1 Tax=Frigidibacter sp. ROC022 TaxID=2971796 RepID=UPI00215AF8F1|nr:TadE family protein [Frigidibacter sp. ROC022]MCR8723678.1 pilus assembly protein [Frigidibacter sp. ROC022]